ncbi:MAG: CopG family transcriptional regulator [Oscillospiraceae bacterium]|nr:CopG family transcriptional regulator [Oscillospiraceae bacterium]
MAKRKILISVPETLLGRADSAASADGLSRSALVCQALCQYLEKRHMLESRERMRRGYEEMAGINRAWAQAGVRADLRILDAYEAMLSESEEDD